MTFCWFGKRHLMVKHLQIVWDPASLFYFHIGAYRVPLATHGAVTHTSTHTYTHAHTHSTTHTQLTINREHKDLPPDPHKIVLPSSGSLRLSFVDLRPVISPDPPPFPPPPPPPKPAAHTETPTAAAATGNEQSSGARFRPAALAAAAAYRAQAAAAAAAAASSTSTVSPLPPPADKKASAAPKADPGPKKPVLLTKPVLMSQQQMDALTAALQHLPTLEPIEASVERVVRMG